MTRYLVCGLHRTGTSALMRAITSASSLTPVVDDDVEALIRSREVDSTYDPNPHGYFCHRSMTAPLDSWIDRLTDSTVAKVSPIAIGYGIPNGNWQVALLNRKRDEVDTSMQRAFGFGVEAQRWTEYAAAQQALDAAANVTVTTVEFADLITSPSNVFDALAHAGWPIDVPTAAATIDPSLYRNF